MLLLVQGARERFEGFRVQQTLEGNRNYSSLIQSYSSRRHWRKIIFCFEEKVCFPLNLLALFAGCVARAVPRRAFPILSCLMRPSQVLYYWESFGAELTNGPIKEDFNRVLLPHQWKLISIRVRVQTDGYSCGPW